jgi:hypothetical protein
MELRRLLDELAIDVTAIAKTTAKRERYDVR